MYSIWTSLFYQLCTGRLRCSPSSNRQSNLYQSLPYVLTLYSQDLAVVRKSGHDSTVHYLKREKNNNSKI